MPVEYLNSAASLNLILQTDITTPYAAHDDADNSWQCVVDLSGTVRQAALSQNKGRRVVGIAGPSPDEVDKRRRRYHYRAHFRRHCGRFTE